MVKYAMVFGAFLMVSPMVSADEPANLAASFLKDLERTAGAVGLVQKAEAQNLQYDKDADAPKSVVKSKMSGEISLGEKFVSLVSRFWNAVVSIFA